MMQITLEVDRMGMTPIDIYAVTTIITPTTDFDGLLHLWWGKGPVLPSGFGRCFVNLVILFWIGLASFEVR